MEKEPNFFERNKKKSLLALLLLFIRGRGKYAVILLVLCFASFTTVALSVDKAAFMANHPSLASILQVFGWGSSLKDKASSQDMFSADFRNGKSFAFWSNFFKKINAPLPPASQSLAMAYLNGSTEGLGGSIPKEEVQKVGPSEVDGVAQKDRSSYDEGVDLSSLFNDIKEGGTENSQGTWARFGDTLANLYGPNGDPYANKDVLLNDVSTSNGGNINDLLDSASAKIPAVDPQEKKQSGRASGFAWKKMGSSSKNFGANASGNKKAIGQLGETVALSNVAAYKTDNMEQAVTYSGVVFDNTDSAGATLTSGFDTGVALTSTGESDSYVESSIQSAGEMQESMEACQNATNSDGQIITDDTNEINEIGTNMGNPPKCCSKSAVKRWNKKCDRMYELCTEINEKQAHMESVCQTYSAATQDTTASANNDCSTYQSIKIKTCSKWKCFFAILLVILTLGLLLPIIAAVVIVSYASNSGATSGVMGFINNLVNKIAGGD